MYQTEMIISYVAKGLEALGVFIIAAGAVISLVRFLIGLSSKTTGNHYGNLRKEMGKAILLGLEVLVAADIIATVVTEPTLEKVLILGIIVLIRTFLSVSLQVEIEGKFPWQAEKNGEMN